MYFDTIKTSLLCILGSASKLIDDIWNLSESNSQRRPYLLLAKRSINIALNRKRRGCNRYISSMKIRVRYSSNMPELKEDLASCLVNRICYSLPTLDLARRVDPWSANITNTLRAPES